MCIYDYDSKLKYKYQFTTYSSAAGWFFLTPEVSYIKFTNGRRAARTLKTWQVPVDKELGGSWSG